MTSCLTCRALLKNSKKQLIAEVHTHSSHNSISQLARRLTHSPCHGLAGLRAGLWPSAQQKASGLMAEGLVQQEVHQGVSRSSQGSQTKQTALQLHNRRGGDS